MRHKAQVRVVAARAWDVDDDNVDVEVTLPDGARYAATFFTLANIQSLFRKNIQTGECDGGLYLWASDMIIVRQLTQETIERAVDDLMASGEFSGAFSRLESQR